jgi:molecular chaperone DnaK
VDGLVAAGDRYREADELRRSLAELKNQAETIIYTTEQAVEAYGDLIPEEQTTKVRTQVQTLKALLASGAGLDAIRAAYMDLESAAYDIAERMYGDAEAPKS